MGAMKEYYWVAKIEGPKLCGAPTLELARSASTPINTCPYAGDTVCDEPKFCPDATDCDDRTLVGQRHVDCPLPPTPAPPETNTYVDVAAQDQELRGLELGRGGRGRWICWTPRG